MSTTTIVPAVDPEAPAADPKLIAFARNIARRIASRSGALRHLEDLEAAALVGLVQAARSFDPECGCQFQTHATNRISSAVLDELRSIRCRGFGGATPLVRRGEWVPCGSLDADRVGGDSTIHHGKGRALRDLVPSRELPIGWEVESEDEVHGILDPLGRDGTIVADYVLRADRRTLKAAAAARGLCESSGSKIVSRIIGELRREEKHDVLQRR